MLATRRSLAGGLVWVVIRWFERRARASEPQKSGVQENGISALQILRQRYARGEIDLTTFERMREHLHKLRILAKNGRLLLSIKCA